ncbi:MAG: CynX/NimT family MFS transporter, partial [Pseudomonadales bacterium]
MAVNPHRLGVLAVLWLAGLYLRLPMLVAPPLAPLIGAELSLNQSQIGALTTIPVLMLALGALPGSFFIARLGPGLALVLALVLLALASAGRGLAPPPMVLFACTVLLGFAVAVMQPALPVLVGQWLPGSLALGSAVYMNGMLMGEFIGAGLTLPVVMPLLDGDWRATLLVWSLPALVVAALVGAISRSRSGDRSYGEASRSEASRSGDRSYG